MKRLAILLFCTSAYAGEGCKDGLCQIEEAKLLLMRDQWAQMKQERDNAMDAYRVMRAQLNYAECRFHT